MVLDRQRALGLVLAKLIPWPVADGLESGYGGYEKAQGAQHGRNNENGQGTTRNVIRFLVVDLVPFI